MLIPGTLLRLSGRAGLTPGRRGWPSAAADGMRAPAAGSLVLARRPEGPLGLASPAGDLGGLALPPWLAAEGDRRFMLDPSGRLLRLMAGGQRFERLPRFDHGPVAAILLAGGVLYLALPEAGRVIGRDAGTLAIRLVIERPGAGLRPIALALAGRRLLILDGGRHLLSVPLGREAPLRAVAALAALPPVERVLALRDGRFALKEVGAARLQILDRAGQPVGEALDPADVEPLAPAPALLDRHGRIRPAGPAGPAFSRAGQPLEVAADEPAGLAAFVARGSWVSQPLDAGREDARWQLVRLALTSFPPGTGLELRSLTANERSIDGREPRDLPSSAWDPCLAVAASLQPAQPDPGLDQLAWVQSPPGRFLWLRLELKGDGHATPALARIDLRHDAPGAIDLLPRVYRDEPETRRFLERFLALADLELERVEDGIEARGDALDPRLAPAAELERLARWLGVTLEQRWNEAGRRRMLAIVKQALGRRSTPAGVQLRLAAALAAGTGLPLERLAGFPRIVEGFQRRRALRLGRPGAALPASAPVWCAPSPQAARLDAGAREGEVRFAGPEGARADEPASHAHRFQVLVPAALLPDQDAVAAFARAVEQAKPAHTAWQLERVPSGIVVGRRASLGLDTILGDRRPATLAREGTRAGARLGVDALIARSRRGGLILDGGARLGARGPQL